MNHWLEKIFNEIIEIWWMRLQNTLCSNGNSLIVINAIVPKQESQDYVSMYNYKYKGFQKYIYNTYKVDSRDFGKKYILTRTSQVDSSLYTKWNHYMSRIWLHHILYHGEAPGIVLEISRTSYKSFSPLPAKISRNFQ